MTLVRTAASVTLGVGSIVTHSVPLLVVAYVVYWIGDMLDGWAARRLSQETRTGAVLDIICDRACTAIACCSLVLLLPQAAAVAIAFLLSFMVLDTMLSLAFLCWPILSPNYFYRVDPRVYSLNWSPTAKVLNTAGVVGAIALHQYELALAVTFGIACVKTWSLIRVAQLLDGAAT